MATLGSLNVVFGAETDSLRQGVTNAIESLESLRDSIAQVSSQMRSLLGGISRQDLSLQVRSDTSEVERASDEIDELASRASNSVGTVRFNASTELLESGVREVEGLVASVTGASPTIRPSLARGFAGALGEAARRTGEDAVPGTEGLDAARAAARDTSAAISQSYEAVRSAANSSASAISAIGTAVAATQRSAETGTVNLSALADAAVIAAGRTSDAISSLRGVGGAFATAFSSAAVSGAAFARSLGGIEAILAAYRGSAAASAIVTGGLAGITASAAASLTSYAAIVAAARFATAGLSEEARGYVDTAAAIIGAGVSLRAGAAAGAAAYRSLAAAIFASGSASAAATAAFQTIGGLITAGAVRTLSWASVLLTLQSSLKLVTAAANEKTTGFDFAGMIARSAVLSAGLGAASGAMGAFAAGSSVAAGAVSGAVGAVGAFAAAMPTTIALAAAAAVATGKFEDAILKLSLEAQSIDQMAYRFGNSTQEMTKLKIAADNTNVGMGQLVRGQQTFYSNLSKIKAGQINVDSVREAKLAFDKLDLTLADLKGRKPDEVFKLVSEKIGEIKDPADRTRVAMDLFGRQGAAIIPALREFAELEMDFKRIGGALNDVDFQRFTTAETSFDRIHAAAHALGQTMMLPFVELQKGLNNMKADVIGGLTSALMPIATMLADMTKPLAVVFEMIGRIANVALRLVGVLVSVAAYFQVFATVAKLFEGIQAGFLAAIAPIEQMIEALSRGGGQASALAAVMDVAMAAVRGLGTVIGFVIGLLSNLLIGIATVAAGWAIYNAAVALASATSLVAAGSFAVAWAAALAPLLPVVAVLAALGAAVTVVAGIITSAVEWIAGFASALTRSATSAAAFVAGFEAVRPVVAIFSAIGSAVGVVWKAVSSAAGWVYRLGESFSFAGEESEKIDAASASVSNLAKAAQATGGLSFATPVEAAEEYDTIASAVEEARSRFDALTIEAAKFGEGGADAAARAQTDFDKLQQQLADGEITTAEFTEESEKLAESIGETVDLLKSDSPAVTLKKNLALYKQLDDAAKSANKTVRDVGAGRVIEDKFFPTSESIKSQAAQYKNQYIAALEEIKKKQQTGVFAEELQQKRDRNQADFDAGRISRDQFEAVRLELDTTNAQEQASFAAEDAKREFDRQMKMDIELDTSFADNIRKSLDEAFLSPVQKFEDELKKINENKSLTPEEKILAESDLRRKTAESLVGATAQSQFTDRRRDLNEAASAGLIGEGRLQSELQKAADDFAKAVGVTQTPFEAFSSSLSNIATQFGFAGQPIDEVREKLKDNADQLSLFDRAVKESRDNLLASLGIEKTPQQILDETLAKIDEAVNATDPNKRITAEQADEARSIATRKRDEALGAGAGAGAEFADRQKKISEAFGEGRDPARLAIAENKLAIDRRSAAGLDATPAQALKAGVDKVNDAFNVTGKSMDEIRASLSPSDFEEYQKALKKNSDAVKESLGVERTGADKIGESREKLAKAVSQGVITEEEKSKALTKQRDELLSSLGIKKTPSQDFEDAVQKIKDNASELSPEELSKGMKEAKDNLLASLGIDKAPSEQAAEAMTKLREAFNKGQISAEEFAKGSQKAKDTLLQSLGIPLDPVAQLRQRMTDLNDALSSGQITQEEFTRGQDEAKRAMLPGGEQESPVKKFQRDMEQVERAASEGLIGQDEADLRKANLQAQLQEDLKPSLDMVSQDRRGIEGSDVRSKAGVDTFFRILRGNDNPSLKAQLETARNTKLLAEAAREPKAAPVIAQLSVR